MRTSRLLFYLLVYSLLQLSITSCGSRKEQKEAREEAGKPEQGKLQQDEFINRLDIINPGLKDPSTIITLLESTGAEYIPGLVNDSDMDNIYLSDSALSALNLGIYTVDLVYLLAYEKDEKADIWLEKSRNLADNIGAGHIYDQAMYRRYMSAGVPKDTLMQVLSKAAESMEHAFGDKELLRLYTLFAAGEFIEKLHLTTSLLVQADKEERDYYWTVMILVFQQEKALDNLISLLDRIRAKEEGERFMAMMSDLKLIFMELGSGDEMAGINTQNITENQTFIDLVDHIRRVRNMIIMPE